MKIYFGYKILRKQKRKEFTPFSRFSFLFPANLGFDYLVCKIAVFLPGKESELKLDGSWVIPKDVPDTYQPVILQNEYMLTCDLKLVKGEKCRILEETLNNHVDSVFWTEENKEKSEFILMENN
jgi:hypothetical protein